MERPQAQTTRRWTKGVPIGSRGPGESYRPDDVAPTMFGVHQPGITTPVLDHLAFAALDVDCENRTQLAGLLAALTDEAEALMVAQHRAPDKGRPAGDLTISLGLGPGLFDERFGLTERRPVALTHLPAFPGDELDPSTTGGDLCIQVCAQRPSLARDSLARLIALAAPGTRVRWSERGSMRRRPNERPDGRPRNLLGFKDATANPRRGKDHARHVWAGSRERSWMVDGTFLVVRKIRVALSAWNALSLDEQEAVIGRHRDSGAPLGRTHEFEAMPLDDPAIPPGAHARVASPHANEGRTVLRRGYSYEKGAGDLVEAGLLLLLHQRDPRRQFVPLQRRLAEQDELRRFTTTVASGVFAIPPGARRGRAIAHHLTAM